MSNRTLVIALCCMAVMAGCKKEDQKAGPVPMEMETGIYSGKYTAKNAGVLDTRYQFKVSVNQVNDTLYTVHQIDQGYMPEIQMIKGTVLSSGPTTKIKFRIPHQNINGVDIVGDGGVSNGYDAQWNALDHSITIGFVFDNDPQRYIRFKGILE